MPKLKTHKGASKRFKITAGGKIKRSRAYGSHLLTKKSAKRKRRLKTPTVVFSGDLSKFKRLLPYG